MYQKIITEKLSLYKKKKFPSISDGLWRGVKYSHILDVEHKDLNVIEFYRNNFFKSKYSKIKLHDGFNHLNSSQAMCINFFYPLINENKLDLILDILGFNGETINYDTVTFEKESSIDNYKGQTPTSFDFYFETESGKQFFFEIKYTENGFGRVNNTIKYRTKFNEIYKHHLNSLKSEFHAIEKFLSNYQVFRNLIHINEDNYVIFLYPEANTKIFNTVANVKKSFLIDSYHNHFFGITWERILYQISKRDITTNTKNHYLEFIEKYNIILKPELIENNIDKRVLDIISWSWELLVKKIGNGIIPINKEASLQLQFAYYLKQSLELIRIHEYENFELELETGVNIKGRTKEIDVLVKYTSKAISKKVAIEMKCYKTLASSGNKRGAQDLFRFGIYQDIELLENYLKECDIDFGVALAMTDHRNFVFPESKEAKSWDYDISDDHMIINGISIETPIGGKPARISLEKSYTFKWKNYGDYWFLELHTQ